ncbi:Uncharacterised protein [Achromobacter sp. 2789STDY5608615]|nr:Uncharacterised protein [Achromobacter sp. 2789STDY5608615]
MPPWFMFPTTWMPPMAAGAPRSLNRMTPRLFSCRILWTVYPPRFRLAPDATVRPEEFANAFATPDLSVPASIRVSPVWLVAVLKVRVLLPRLMTSPVPEIEFPKVTASLRSKARTALLTIAPPTEPLTAPAPSCSTPALMTVLPVYVFSPDRIRVPAPFLCTPTSPLITPAYCDASLRSNTMPPRPVKVTSAAKVPLAPPSPMRSVPPSTVVSPV